MLRCGADNVGMRGVEGKVTRMRSAGAPFPGALRAVPENSTGSKVNCRPSLPDGRAGFALSLRPSSGSETAERFHPHSLSSGRVQVESAIKKSQRTAEVRGEGSIDESHIAIGFKGMFPWFTAASIDLQSILVFALRCRAEGDQHENFADVALCDHLDGLHSFECVRKACTR
jgi:hypothetical protein